MKQLKRHSKSWVKNQETRKEPTIWNKQFRDPIENAIEHEIFQWRGKYWRQKYIAEGEGEQEDEGEKWARENPHKLCMQMQNNK